MSYEDVSENIWMNYDYMMNLYLPGIFLSHFLWRHHYRQFLYYKEHFLPLIDGFADKRFYEVGTGTGFYTLQIFRHNPSFHGLGIDISPHSREFTMNNIKGWGFDKIFTSLNVNIIGADLVHRAGDHNLGSGQERHGVLFPVLPLIHSIDQRY